MQKAKSLYSPHYISMCIANALVCTYLFALIPLIFSHSGGSLTLCTAALLCFAAGLFAMGPTNTHLVEKFTRKGLYLKAVLLLIALNFAIFYAKSTPALLLCFGVQGMLFAVAQNALGNTLVNDLMSSEKRTLGDNLYSWYGRLGIPFGWLWAIALLHFNLPTLQTAALAVVPCVVALLLILCVKVPLKAPVHTSFFSLDRYFLPKAWPLFVLALVGAAVEGIILAMALRLLADPIVPALYLAAGFLVALWLQRIVFVQAVDKAEMIAGTLLTLAALLMLRHSLPAVRQVAFLCLGAGIGMMAARLLMYFLKISGHCQRGTVQNTYMLGWRTGFALGFLIAEMEKLSTANCQLSTAIAFVVAYALFYFFYVHPWFCKHKNRDFKFRE